MPSAELHARLAYIKRRTTKLRMRIVLELRRWGSGTMIAQRLGTTVNCLQVARRYRAYRLAGLTMPRAGRPRSVGDEQVQLIVDKVRQSKA